MNCLMACQLTVYFHEVWTNKLCTIKVYTVTARGRVGRVTDCGVRGFGFKSPGSNLISRTETSSLSRVVRDGWDPCSIPLKWVKKKSPAVESSTCPLNSHNCSENDTKTKTKTKLIGDIWIIFDGDNQKNGLFFIINHV